jgi:hypothetical protein
MADVLSSRWNPVRFQIIRRSLVETTDSTLVALPIGFAEVEGALLIMAKERIRIRVVDGEIERLLEVGDVRKL